MTRDELVQSARADIAAGSKSFRLASTLFDRRTRERAWLLYAWCRACDDLADGQTMGHGMRPVDDPAARLARIRALTADAMEGRETGVPAFDGLGVVAIETGISQAHVDDLIQGFALDAAGWRPETAEDLLRYCYHVAGVVGVMMALVMGVPASAKETLDRACDLGLAFQLANIARDVAEDDAAGRCYLPAAWLREAQLVPGELTASRAQPKLALLVGRLDAMARTFEASARIGARALPLRSRWAVLAAAGIYGGIMRKVARRGAAAWDQRVTTSRPAKLGWVARAGGQALLMSLRRHPA